MEYTMHTTDIHNQQSIDMGSTNEPMSGDYIEPWTYQTESNAFMFEDLGVSHAIYSFPTRYTPPQDNNNNLTNMDFEGIWSLPTSPQEVLTPRRSADDYQQNESEVEEPIVEVACKYDLRPQIKRVKQGFTSTWMDKDNTGNFDPSEEFRQARARLSQKRAKARSRKHAGPRKDSMFEGDADDEAPPKIIPTLVVTLSTTSEVGKRNFEQLVNTLPVKPKAPLNTSSNGYGLRKRKHATAFQYTDDYDKNKLRATYDLPEDLTGHPLARGCWECVALGKHECSLLSDEHTWPCVTCLEDDNECELITQPVRKRVCERCKRRRNACSFSYTLNHGDACQQCMEDGHRCIAGPAKDAVRTRLSHERAWEGHVPSRPRQARRKDTTCLECDEADVTCSLSKANNGQRACEACLAHGKPCTLESLAPHDRTSLPSPISAKEAKDGREMTSSKSVTQSQPEEPKIINNTSQGKVKKVTTKFSHPIAFNYVDKTNGEKPCHFCAERGFALFGFGSKVVEVIDWKDGRGLDEIKGGHKGEGMENTRVCTTCTLGRLQMIMCSAHEMRPIAGAQKGVAETHAAFEELFAGNTKKARRWCSLCLNLATYECRTASDMGRGCGLQLCETCTVRLAGAYDGDLQKMLPEVEDVPVGSSMGLRADFEMLKQDGLLMRYVLWSN